VPPQNPLTRIEQVARDLGQLAEQLGDTLGPEARRAFRHWQQELRSALDELREAKAEVTPLSTDLAEHSQVRDAPERIRTSDFGSVVALSENDLALESQILSGRVCPERAGSRGFGTKFGTKFRAV
jgi:hypothetical protein